MILLHTFCNIVGKKNSIHIHYFLKSVVNMAELLLRTLSQTFVTISFVTVHVIMCGGWREIDDL